MGRMMRAASFGISCLILAGCSGGVPSIVLDTPSGPTPIYTPTPAPMDMPGGGVGPPPGMQAAVAMPGQQGTPPVPGQMVSRSGSYAGTAVPLDTGGGVCLATKTVHNFFVRGDSVRYGGFHGTIDGNGGLQMVFADRWIIGQFDGTTFRGQFELAGGFNFSGCTYML